MKRIIFLSLKKELKLVLVIVIWLIAAWLLFPLINLDTVNMENAKEYLYRSAAGLTIMIIFFGKTIIDLLFPQVTLKRMPLLNTILLTIYSLAIASGIVFMIVRMAVLYVKSKKSGFLF